MAACLFCRIVAGEIPATKLAENDRCVAFLDINPQAPVHVLVIPKQHFDSVIEVHDGAVMGELVEMARGIAKAEGISKNGFRLVINTGVDGAQSVEHLHLHLLGGRKMNWPPG